MKCSIGSIRDKYKRWYDSQVEANSSADKDKLDAELKNIWNKAILDKSSSQLFKYIVKRDTDTSISFNGGKSVQTRVLAVDANENGTLTVSTSDGTYTFDGKSSRSLPTSGQAKVKTVTMPIMDNIVNNTALDFELGSSSANSREERMERLENEVHKNVEAMQDFVDMLDGVDGVKASPEHKQYLKELIGTLDQRYLNDMNTWLSTEASQNAGMINSGNIKISVSKADAIAGNQQSAAEVYTHEVIHSYTSFALRSGDTAAKRVERELRYVMDVARKNITWRDFLPSRSIDANAEKAEAQRMWNYIFNNEEGTGLDEFIAHVLTNPQMLKKAKEIKLQEQVQYQTLFDKMIDFFRTIMHTVVGNYNYTHKNRSVAEQVNKLAFELAQYNNKAIRKAKNNHSPVDLWFNMLNEADVKISAKMREKLDAMEQKFDLPEPLPQNASKLAYAIWLAKFAPKMLIDTRLRPYLELIMSAFGLKPEGFVQNVIRDFRTPDDLERTIEVLDLQSSKIDQTRENMVTSTKDNILGGFRKDLTKQEKDALTNIIVDTDIQVLTEKYSNKKIRRFLKDPVELDRIISRTKHELKTVDKFNYNWNVNQAQGLGFYLATHKSNIAQNLNANNIARGILTESVREPNPEVVKLVDEVATLVALKYSPTHKKLIVEDLMKNETTGVKNVIGIHKGFVESSEGLVFGNAKTNMIKGYSKEIFDDKISISIKPVANAKEMESQGYELVKVLPKSDRDGSTVPMGLYVSQDYNTQEYYRTATRLTSLNKKGTTLTDVRLRGDENLAKRKAALDRSRIDRDRRKIVEDMQKGEFNIEEVETALSPLLNDKGEVVDYRYTMNKKLKKDLLGQDTDVANVLGRSIGSIYDKNSTEVHNKAVLDVILADMKENYVEGRTLGLNDKEYILVSKNHEDPKIRELASILPSSFKEQISKSGFKSIAIRQDMLLNFFGFRHFSVANTWAVKITPHMIQKLVRLAEMMWQEIIKISKVDILIRTPIVITENIISNFMFSVMTGTNPLKLIKMYLESARNVRDYLNKHKELTDLEIAEKSGNILKRDLTRMNKLREDLKANNIHELMEAGIYQAIIEDVSRHDLQSNNKITQLVDEATDGMPGFVKNGAHWLYLSEKTAYFRFMTNTLQASDLIARDIENQKLKALGVPKEKRLESVLDNFINYNKPATSLEEYANKMGMVMFTKYAKRIQRVISSTAMQHPLKTLLVLLGQEYLVDVETITDQSVLTRSWASLDQDIMEHLERLIPVTFRVI